MSDNDHICIIAAAQAAQKLMPQPASMPSPIAAAQAAQKNKAAPPPMLSAIAAAQAAQKRHL